jgi:hypothetical protein
VAELGRRAGLRSQWAERPCGFKSRPRHHKIVTVVVNAGRLPAKGGRGVNRRQPTSRGRIHRLSRNEPSQPISHCKEPPVGSSVGFHAEELTRIGKFYFKTNKAGAEAVANDYAKLMWPPTQARKEDYDPDWFFRLRREPELTYEKIKEITGIDDVFDLYLTMWEMAGGPDGYVRDAASVVLKIVIDNPDLRNSTYVDEDILIEKATQGPIDPDEVIRLAMKDSEFRRWVKWITGKKDDQLGSTTYKELENGLFTRSDGPLPWLAIRMIFRNAYEALLRILKEGKKEDREEVADFLRRVASDANSFFFDRIVSFDEVEEITAEVTTEWGEKKTIDLKSGKRLSGNRRHNEESNS